jgi:ABC-type lipoprotein release transport system permease subunit
VQRHLQILDYALGCLLRRRGKSLAIIVVYAFTIATLASILFLTQALRIEAVQLLEQAPELVVQRTMAGRHELIPVTYADVVRGLPGVAAVQPRYWGYYYDALLGANYTLQTAGDLRGLTLVSGRAPATRDECLLGAGVAEARKVGVGDDLILIDSRGIGIPFDIVGLFSADANLLTHDLIILDEAALINFFGLSPGMATDLSVRVRNPREVTTVAEKIQRQLPDTRPISRAQFLRTYDAVFNWRSGMLLTLFLSALVAFCILAWDKATGLSAEEQREIGILKALGWDTADVLELKLWEGLAISLTALLLGLIAAYLHVFLLGAPMLMPVLKGWSILFPAFRLTPRLDLYQLAVLAFLAVVPYVASTVIPSWKAAITDPDRVLRG